MLVLKRKRFQKIRIGENVVVKVIHTGPAAVRLGIEAPDDVRILRDELCDEGVGERETAPVTIEDEEELVDAADPVPLPPVMWDMAISDQFPQAI